MASFWKLVASCQTVLPDRPILIGWKLIKNGKIQKLNWDIFGDFQTMWLRILLPNAMIKVTTAQAKNSNYEKSRYRARDFTAWGKIVEEGESLVNRPLEILLIEGSTLEFNKLFWKILLGKRVSLLTIKNKLNQKKASLDYQRRLAD